MRERERERERPLLLLNRVLNGDHRALNRALNDVIENFLIYKKTQLTQLSSIV